jgi:hypothetical protein
MQMEVAMLERNDPQIRFSLLGRRMLEYRNDIRVPLKSVQVRSQARLLESRIVAD